MNGLSGMPPSLMAGICTGAALAILLLLIGAVWSLIERRRTAQAHEPIVMIELGHVDGVVVDTEDEEEEGLGLVELTDMVPMPPPTPMPPPLPTPPAGAPLVKQGPRWMPRLAMRASSTRRVTSSSERGWSELQATDFAEGRGWPTLKIARTRPRSPGATLLAPETLP